MGSLIERLEAAAKEQLDDKLAALLREAASALQSVRDTQLRTNERGDVVRVHRCGHYVPVGVRAVAHYSAVRIAGVEVESRQPLSAQEVEALWPYVVQVRP